MPAPPPRTPARHPSTPARHPSTPPPSTAPQPPSTAPQHPSTAPQHPGTSAPAPSAPLHDQHPSTTVRQMHITDAHIHIQPFQHMPAAIAETFWRGKPNRAELEGYTADPIKLLARMDADGIARVGLINYVSPDLMGFSRGVARSHTW